MRYKVGIDIGGTFTDVIAIGDGGETYVHKTLSTPEDPSIGFINGLTELAEKAGLSARQFVERIDTIVHGTTVATNALLTFRGAKTALLTTRGFRDALEMRRGIREEQYNNRYENVTPMVPRHLRLPVDERVDAEGNVVRKLNRKDLEKLAVQLKAEKVESVAVCFINSYKNPAHELQAAAFLRKKLKHCFVTASCEVLPCIRFYERVSTTVVSAFVGPIVARYIDRLEKKLAEVAYRGTLLIMQSNGGVVAPEVVKRIPVVTVLSGPAAAPTAGAYYATMLGYENCITVDMGGTSFDAALVIGGECVTSTEGSINRYRIALPSLDIVTIGAGGGSLGWINNGGMLQMGPQSAGALPGPASYGRGGSLPACTDADLLLGYLDPGFFAGGRLKLDVSAAQTAIGEHLAKPLGLSLVETAAGMYRIINSNMAQGVRQISVERGYDPREFLFIVAGGAGPVHAAEICSELEIPAFLVPSVSSIFCAAGMLLGDLKHDYIRSCYASFRSLDRKHFLGLFAEMQKEGVATLKKEGVAVSKISFHPVLDMRYAGQYHEVQLAADWRSVQSFALTDIFEAFHAEHNRQFGYSLKDEGTEIELINVRLRVVGKNEKPQFAKPSGKPSSAAEALKGHREVYIPELQAMRNIAVYDGDLYLSGTLLKGPCVIERITTSIFVSERYDCLVDPAGSFLVYERARFPGGESEIRKRYRQR
jgi:N-methylhydantoinase A